MTSPSCSTCGMPLVWHYTHHAWGCDRCRIMQPAIAPHAAAAAPQPPSAQHAVPAKKSRTGLYLGLGALAVIGGVVIAIVPSSDGGGGASGSGGGASGGGSGGGGPGAREDAVKQTFAAISAGNADALLELSGTFVEPDSMMSCKKQPPRPTAEMRKQAREQAIKAMDEFKGAAIEILEIGADADPKTVGKGAPLGDTEYGCTTNQQVAQHTFDVRIKVSASTGKSAEQTAEMTLVNIGSRWFIDKLPKIDLPTGCDGVARPIEMELNEELQSTGIYDRVAVIALFDAYGKVAVTRCRDDAWNAAAVNCLKKLTSYGWEATSCVEKLSPDQRKKYEADRAAAYAKYAESRRDRDDELDRIDDDAMIGEPGPRCKEFKRSLDKLETCSAASGPTKRFEREWFEKIGKFAAAPDSAARAERKCDTGVEMLTAYGKRDCGW